MAKEDKNIRQVGFCDSKVELRAGGEGAPKKIYGEAIVFNRESHPIGGFFIEVIKPGALDNANMDRVVARTNHDDGVLLGTSWAGTLELNSHENGLSYEVEVPKTTAGRDTEVYVERGDIAGSSFAFIPDYRDGGVQWIDRSDEGLLDIREIHKIKTVFDVSPVVNPAYQDSSAGVREHREWRKDKEDQTQRSIDEAKNLKANSDTLLAIHKHKLKSQ